MIEFCPKWLLCSTRASTRSQMAQSSIILKICEFFEESLLASIKHDTQRSISSRNEHQLHWTGSIMETTTRLLLLPTELQLQVISHLDLLAAANLRLSCRRFYDIIPKLTNEQLLELERSEFAKQKKLYFCGLCGRLRTSEKFPFATLYHTVVRGGIHAPKRVCRDCGTCYYFPNLVIYLSDSVTRKICAICMEPQIVLKREGNVWICFPCAKILNTRRRALRALEEAAGVVVGADAEPSSCVVC